MDVAAPAASPLLPPSVPPIKAPGASTNPLSVGIQFQAACPSIILEILMILGLAVLLPLVGNCVQEIKFAAEKGHAELKKHKSRRTLKSTFLSTNVWVNRFLMT